ncbi:hypothetical protein PF003_g26454 [Phytophthora fragariae]|nr:hypothetical protein PF003_g26454 [Phytophthora fragariae]
MVTPAGKSPRHTLTEQERQRCLEALLSERHARRIRRAQGKQKKAATKRAAKHTTPAMERAESKGASAPTETAEQANIAEAKEGAANDAAAEAKESTAEAATETAVEAEASTAPSGGEVEGVVADLVASVAANAAAASTRASGADATSSGKPKQRKRRRAVLQDDSTSEVETNAGERDDARAEQILNLQCIIDGDANLMATGADNCTELNSDEDPALPEEPESEEDDDDDEWVEDWTIGEPTDEDSDEETMPLPDSVCLTAARNKKTMSMMKTHGWEYGTL